MTRNTHDLALDHHGAFTTGGVFTDQGSDPAAPASGKHVLYSKSGGLYVRESGGTVVGPLAAYTVPATVDLTNQGSDPSSPASGHHTLYSKSDGVYIKNSSGTVIGPLGSGGGGILDLLTGNDSEFTTTVGNWTNSGGTLERDTTAAYRMDGLAASLKFTTTAQNQYIEVPVSGTFRAGHEYHAAIAIEAEPNTASGTSYNFQFGLLGSDTRSLSASGQALPVGSSMWLVANWIPTADRTGVKLRLSRAGAETGTVVYHVSWARVSEVGLRSTGLFTVTKPNGSNYQMLGTVFGAATLGYGRGAYELSMAKDWGSLSDYNWTSGVYSQPGYLWIWGEHTPSDKAQTGVQVQAGSDYLGFYISEKNATTLQMYADDDHSIELEDSATGGWKFVSGDGAVAWPAKGKRPQYSSAPSTPAEGQSYYDTTAHKEYVWNGSSWVELGVGTGMSNPMTTEDDVIVGGSAGAPARLAKGSDSQVLTIDPSTHHVAWKDPTGGMSNPMTTVNDLILGGTSGAPTRLAKGNDSQVLSVDASTHNVMWKDLPAAGMSNPMTTQDDIIIGSTAGAAARLAKGTDGQVLTIDPSTHHVVWDDPAAGASALDDLTDVVITTPADGEILTYDSGSSMWVNAAAPGGSEMPVVAAKYTTAAGQSITSGAAAAIIDFGTSVYDTHSAVTTGASWKFTAPVAGKYHVQAEVYFDPSGAWAYNAADRALLSVYVNGTLAGYLWREDYISASSLVFLGGATDLDLAADDYVDIRIQQNSGSAIALAADALGNHVSIHRIGGGGTVIGTGTSFPGSPSTNDLCYRTDLGMLFFYNGTRWLSTTLYSLDIGVVGGTLPLSATGTIHRVQSPPLRGGSDIWIEDERTSWFVNGGTALDASNKWVGTFTKSADGSASVPITVNITSGTLGAWHEETQAVDALQNNGTTYLAWTVTWTKTGTPGTLIALSTLTYRIVAT